jgi:5-methylcytosine-specific restriction enzyme subunit McrC
MEVEALEPREAEIAEDPQKPKLYRIPEHAPADVPLTDLLDASGRLRLNPEVESKGYFTIQLHKGRVRLQARGFVGLIPLNERVVIDVRPRVPISNLSRLLRLSRHLPDVLPAERGYALDDAWNESLLDIYARALITHFQRIASAGLLRDYERRQADSSFPHGRLLAGETVTRVRSRGISHTATMSWHERSVDNACNRCLKYAIWFLATRYIRLRASPHARRELHQQLNALHPVLSGVKLDHSLQFIEDPLVRGTRPLPTLRTYYRRALDIAVAIILEHAVEVESNKRPESLRLPSLILNMSSLFEAYLRNTLRSRAKADGWNARVLDGNTEGKKLLFDHAPSEDATPDIVVRDLATGECSVLIEVKNIPVKYWSPRAAIEQAVTYGASYRCNRVVLAHPCDSDHEPQGLRLLGRIGDLAVYQYLFNLGTADLVTEENCYGRAVGQLAECR